MRGVVGREVGEKWEGRGEKRERSEREVREKEWEGRREEA